MRALIGHTGFVGSNLLRAGGFDATFNSRNIGDLPGQCFSEVICAGVSAAKWIANREPEADRAAINVLTKVLERTSIDRFVLISTIDVYPDPSLNVDETYQLMEHANHAYGLNRFALEQWVRSRYANHLIVRLPAVFGLGLKKNALYDLLCNHAVAKINPASVFQWYPVERLTADLATAMAAGLQLVNLFTAPVTMSTIIDRHFPDAPVGPPGQPGPRYQLRTRHDRLFGGCGGYVMTREQELRAIEQFIAAEQRRSS